MVVVDVVDGGVDTGDFGTLDVVVVVVSVGGSVDVVDVDVVAVSVVVTGSVVVVVVDVLVVIDEVVVDVVLDVVVVGATGCRVNADAGTGPHSPL